MMCTSLRRICLIAVFVMSLGTIAEAQGPVIGTPPWNSFGGGPFDAVNLGNLNVHFAIPIRHKAGRGLPLAYDLTYDSSIWYAGSVNGVTTWLPSNNGYWGWQGLTAAGSTTNLAYSVSYSSGNCGQFGTDTWQQWQYTNLVYYDNQGAHNINFQPAYVQSNGPAGQCPPTGPQPPTETGVPFTDGSGLTLYAAANSNSLSWNVTTASGTTFNNGAGGVGGTDANGNQITVSGGVVTDTLGVAALTIAGTAPSNTTLSYAAPGGTATYAMSYKQYTVNTNFGCSGIAEYNFSQPLPDKLTLPDGTYYQFQYESTVGGSGQVTGRLTQVTLPTGGSIRYTYPIVTVNGVQHNGINCSDGSAPATNPSLTRVVSPGGTWQYARQIVSGNHWQTTITDPSNPSNQTLVDLQQDSSTSYSPSFFETERRVYQGSTSGTLLSSTITCYNTVNPTAANCPTTAVSNPISRRTVFSYLSSAVSETDTQYGYVLDPNFPTEVDSYDYGTGSPGSVIRKVITQYNAYGSNVQPTSVQIKDGSGNVKASTTYSYDETTPTATSGTPQHTSVTGGRGNLTTLATQANGGTTLYRKFTYYDTGTPNTVSDLGTAASGGTNLTTYNYNNSGTPSPSCGNSFVTSIAEPMTLSQSYTWDCNGGVQLTATDENDKSSTTHYSDPNFWRPDYVKDQLQYQMNLSYTQQTAVEAKLNVATNSVLDVRSTVDGFGRSILTQKAQTPSLTQYDTAETDYDTLGRPSRSTMPFQAGAGGTNGTAPAATTSYDALNRPTTVTDGGGGTVSYTYINNDVLVLTSGGQTFTRQLEYDGLGRLTSVCEVSSSLPGTGACGQSNAKNGYLTKYTYDALGNMLTVSQNSQPGGNSQPRSFVYDMLGRLTSETNPESGTKTYVYDTATTSCGSGTAAGSLVETIDNATAHTCLGVDALRRVNHSAIVLNGIWTNARWFVYGDTSYTPPTGITINNGKNRVVEAYVDLNNNGTKNVDEWFSYDADGHVTDIYESTPHSGGYYHINKQYWPNGTLSQLSGIPGVPTIYYGNSDGSGLDGEGRVTQVAAGSNSTKLVSGASYNLASQVTGVTFGSGDSDAYTFDPNTGRMTQYTFNVNGQSVIGKMGWNANGMLGSFQVTQDPFNPANVQNCTYGYDDVARISSANCGSVWAQTFSYDPFGNITKTGSMTWACATCYNSATNHYNSQLSGSIAYDADGNLTNDTFHTYQWDAYGHAVVIDGSANQTYDAMGHMVELNEPGWLVQFLYDDSGFEFGASHAQGNTFATIPLPGGETALYSGGALQNYNHKDWLGTTRLTSGATAGFVGDQARAPFGESYAVKPGNNMANYYAGLFQNIEGDLFDTQYREYHPTQGRWITPDPAGLAAVDPTNPQSWNRYAYVLNNPLAMIDTLGEEGCYDQNGQAVNVVQDICNSMGGWTWLSGGQWVGSDGNVYNTQYTSGPFVSAGDPGSSDECTGPCMGTLLPGYWTTTNLGSFGNLYGSAANSAGGFLNWLFNKPWVLGVVLPVAGEPGVMGAGPAGAIAYNPATRTICVGAGLGASVGHTAALGPLTNAWNLRGAPMSGAQVNDILSGWSISGGFNFPAPTGPGPGFQVTGNGSGVAVGPSVGIPGLSGSVTWSKCF